MIYGISYLHPVFISSFLLLYITCVMIIIFVFRVLYSFEYQMNIMKLNHISMG